MLQIIAKNQTTEIVTLDDLGQQVPASGEIDLAAGHNTSEVMQSQSLVDAINNDEILLDNGTMTFDKENSIVFVEQWSTKNPVANICLTSPNGTVFSLAVDNDGILTTNEE